MSASHISSLVDAIKIENLHGVTFNSKRVPSEKLSSQLFFEYDDLDAADPRWYDLFYEHFIKNAPPEYDDLLFFVRTAPTSPKTRQSIIHGLDTEMIFVRRREPLVPKMPILSNPVCWKQTLFLNWIVQSPMILTLARKAPDKKQEPVERHSNVVYPSPFRAIGKRKRPLFINKKPNIFRLSPAKRPPSTSSIASETSANSDISLSELADSPDLDNSDAIRAFQALQTQKCTFPWIVFSPSIFTPDTNSVFKLSLGRGDCVCVELAMYFNKIPNRKGCAVETLSTTEAHKIAKEIQTDDTNEAFPVLNSENCARLLLFQGFVSFQALSEAFEPSLKESNYVSTDLSPSNFIPDWISGFMSKSYGAGAKNEKNPTRRSVSVTMKSPDERANCTLKLRKSISTSNSEGPNDEHSMLECSLDSITTPWYYLANDILDFASSYYCK